MASFALRLENFAERKPWHYAFCVAPLTVLVMGFIFRPAYDTGDDVSMQFLASGKANVIAPNEHLVFIHPFIGLMLKFAYSVFPQVPWYGLNLLASHAVAHAVIAGLMLSRNRLRYVAPWFSVWMGTFGLYALTRLQFTTTAFLVGLAGFLMVWEGLKALLFPQERGFSPIADFEAMRPNYERRYAKRLIVAGVACMWWCEMIRSNSFIMCIALMIPTLGLWILSRKAGWKSCLVVATVAAVIVGGGQTLYRIHINYYYADPEWAGFFEYNELRAKFNDHKVVRFSPDKKQIFYDAGWSLNDIQLLRSWCFDDQRVYSAEVMNKILASRNWYGDRYSAAVVLDSLQEISRDTYARYFAAILMISLIAVRKDRTALFLTLAAVATSLGIVVLVTVFQKTPPNRVFLPLMFWPIIVASWATFRNRYVEAKTGYDIQDRVSQENILRTFAVAPARTKWMARYWSRVVTTTLALIVVGQCFIGFQYSRMRMSQAAEFKATMKSWNFRPENLYVIWGTSLPFVNISPFDNLLWLKNLRSISLGWQQTSPTNRRMVERFGMKNVLAEMHLHPEVRIINNPVVRKYYSRYAKQHDNADVTFTQIGKIGDSSVAIMDSSQRKTIATQKSNLSR